MSRMISISNLIPDEENRKFGGTELITTVASVGVLQPLLVTDGPKSGQYYLIDGHRRLASAKAAGLEKVPCEIITAEDAAHAKLLSNLDRKQLSPLDQCRTINELKEIGYDNVSIGNILGISRYQVERRLRLNNLIPELKGKLQEGSLPIEKASEAALADPDIQVKCIAICLNSNYSVSDLRDYINRMKNGISLCNHSDEFISMAGIHGSDCLHCHSNPASDGTLFDGADKNESYCIDGDGACAWDKISRIYTCSKADCIASSYAFEDYFREFIKKTNLRVVDRKYPCDSEPNPDYENQLKAVTLTGDIVYMGGTRKPDDKEIDAEEEQKKARTATAISDMNKAVQMMKRLMIEANRKEPINDSDREICLMILSDGYRRTSWGLWDLELGESFQKAVDTLGAADIIQGKTFIGFSKIQKKIIPLLFACRLDWRYYSIMNFLGLRKLEDAVPYTWQEKKDFLDKRFNGCNALESMKACSSRMRIVFDMNDFSDQMKSALDDYEKAFNSYAEEDS